ncbi:hypothetical protein [Acidimangrovimonas sediminis]|uniref:hypothetical protein n=1 Tax=Acidimangrovimonas sediminis TaxID=2056283 RepID=UPI000C7FBE63|nr:hypothetical protein [Acidimangrovimonas sediminis]
MPKPLTARIEVFRPGTFTPMEGAPLTFSAADLRSIADAYEPSTAPAPIVVGHPQADAPAFGWVESFDYDATGERLFANVHEIAPEFAELVKAGRFKKISMSFFSPEQGHNPTPGSWYPKHVGFLGAAAPAVSGLKNAKFAEPAGAVFTAEFGDPVAEQTASLFRSLRDFLIDRFGLDDADKVLPAYQIEWLDETDDDAPRFAAPPANPKPKKEATVPKEPDPAFAAREAELQEREQRIAAREAETAHASNVSFAEKLVTDGKLIPASQEKVVAILDALPAETSVSFSEGGEKLAPGAALRQVLEAQPKVVSFGEQELGQEPGEGKAASFASDGKPVDPAGLARHQKAQAYMRANPGTAYLDAVHAVS